MLDFALEYRKAVDGICAHRDTALRDFELSENEWQCVKELCDVLKVSWPACHICHALLLRAYCRRLVTLFIAICRS